MQGSSRCQFLWLGVLFLISTFYAVFSSAASIMPPPGTVIRGAATLSYKLGGADTLYQNADEAIVTYSEVYDATTKGNGLWLYADAGDVVRYILWVQNTGNVRLNLNASPMGEDRGDEIDPQDQNSFTALTAPAPPFINVEQMEIYLDRDGRGVIADDADPVKSDEAIIIEPNDVIAIEMRIPLPSDIQSKAKFIIGLNLTAQQGKPFEGKAGEEAIKRDHVNARIDIRRVAGTMTFDVVRELISNTPPTGDSDTGTIHYKLTANTGGTLAKGKDWDGKDLINNKRLIADFYSSDWIESVKIEGLESSYTTEIINWTDRRQSSPPFHNEQYDTQEFKDKHYMVAIKLPEGITEHKPMSWSVKVEYKKSSTEYIQGKLLRTRLYLFGQREIANVLGYSIMGRSGDHIVAIRADALFVVKGFENNVYKGLSHKIPSASVGEVIVFKAKIENESHGPDVFGIAPDNSTFPEGTVFEFAASDNTETDQSTSWVPSAISLPVAKESEKYLFIRARLPARIEQYGDGDYETKIRVFSNRDSEQEQTLTLQLGSLVRPVLDIAYTAPESTAAPADDRDAYQSITASAENTKTSLKGREVSFDFSIQNHFNQPRRLFVNVYKGETLIGEQRPYRSELPVTDWHWVVDFEREGESANVLVVDANESRPATLRLNVPKGAEATRQSFTVIVGDVKSQNNDEVINDALKFYVDVDELPMFSLMPPDQSASVEAGKSANYRYVLKNNLEGNRRVRVAVASDGNWATSIENITYLTQGKTAPIKEDDHWMIELNKDEAATIMVKVETEQTRLLGESDILTLTANVLDDTGGQALEGLSFTAKAVTRIMTGQLQFDKFVAKGENPTSSDFKETVSDVEANDILTWKGVLKNIGKGRISNVVVFDMVPVFTSLRGDDGHAKINNEAADLDKNLQILGGGRKSLIFFLGKQRKGDHTGGFIEPNEEIYYTYQVVVD